MRKLQSITKKGQRIETLSMCENRENCDFDSGSDSDSSKITRMT